MPENLNFRAYLSLLRRDAWLVTVAALLVATAAFVVSLLQERRYETSSTVLYTGPLLPTDALSPGQRTLDTLVALGLTESVLARAAALSGEPPSTEFEDAVDLEPDSRADLIVATASGSTAAQARRRADAVAQALVEWRRRSLQDTVEARVALLERQLSSSASAALDSSAEAELRGQLAEARAEAAVGGVDLAIVEAAPAPTGAASPRPVPAMLIGALAGLLLGIVVASVRGRLDQRLRTVEQVEEAYGVDALGAVPIVREALFRRAAGLGDFVGLSPIAEAYRTIRTNLSLRQVATPDVRVILITSALPGEGKSAVAANLGAALASAGQRVLAVSGDVRSPALHEYFAEHAGDTGRGTTPEWLPAGGGARGLVDVLAGDVPVAEAIRRIQLPSTARWSGELMLLANDRAFVDASILYESRAMQHLLAWARDHFDAVVIDAPALLAGSESPILLRKADAVVLVGRLGRLDRAAVRRARQQLDSAGVTPAGVVVIGGSWTGEPFEARTHRRPGSRPSARGRAMRIAGGRRRPAAARGRDVG